VPLLDELRDRTGSEDLAVAILTELALDERARQTDGWRVPEATEKQLAFLERLNVEFPQGISMEGASILIDQALEQNRESAVPVQQ